MYNRLSVRSRIVGCLSKDEPQLVRRLQRPGVVESADQNRGLVSQVAEAEIGAIAHLIELSPSSEQRSEYDAGVRVANTRVLAAHRHQTVRGIGEIGD